jgi:hypothetical protein
MSTILGVIIAFAIPVFVLAPTFAQPARPVCSDRAKFLNALSSIHPESPVPLGLATNGSVVEVLVSKTGSWTTLVTWPDGRSCVVAVGEGWEALKTTTGPTCLAGGRGRGPWGLRCLFSQLRRALPRHALSRRDLGGGHIA